MVVYAYQPDVDAFEFLFLRIPTGSRYLFELNRELLIFSFDVLEIAVVAIKVFWLSELLFIIMLKFWPRFLNGVALVSFCFVCFKLVYKALLP